MRKTTFLILSVFALTLTACSGSISNAAGLASGTQAGPTTGELSVPLQVAIGTIKLDKSANAITKDEAVKLLPLWETLQQLETSDTAANQEKEALLTQIQETMTKDQMQAITALNLSRRDMASVLPSQGGFTFSGGQNGNTQRQNGNSSSNTNTNRRNSSGGGGGGFFVGGGGPPPDGGGFAGGGNANFQRQGASGTQSNGSTQNANRQFTVDPNRIPTPLIQAVVAYLKTKAGS